MKQVSIIGYGRFGQTLHRLLKDDFDVIVYDKTSRVNTDLKKVYQSTAIFYAVPISEFEEVITSHKQYFRANQVLIDVLAVKLYPAKIFEKHLAGTPTQALLTHPMFGPDSSSAGFNSLPIVLDKFKASDETYTFWKNYFVSKQLSIVEMSPEEHDKMSANSIGLTHFLGRLLEQYKFKATPIDTLGAKKLLEIETQICNDSWQLFSDLQHYNPHTKKMRLKLGDAYDNIYNKLLPEQVHADRLTIGIQGGKGSFNDEAVQHYVKKAGIKDYDIKYLYTSERVLAALHGGEIDHGLFAIHNSVGGMVRESVEAMARYKFSIVEEFAIIIAHALMIRDDAEYETITTVMAHPQVFAQCKTTLARKYPNLKLTSGKGELIDHANVAKHLGAHKLPKEVATMGSKVLADLYNLKIVEDNLQDAEENYTSFLMVRR
jgi:arogenate dehydrogenase (NADP+), plant